MQLRPYQEKAVDSTLLAWRTYRRLLGVAATGAGKTVIAAHILLKRLSDGPALFVAHRDELLDQAIDKLWRVTGLSIGLEQANMRANAGHKVVVGSVMSLHQTRLERWAPNHFKSIIIDECHRSTTKAYQRVLEYFTDAKTLGITATPDRTDQQSLGKVFESIAFEIGLIGLIKDEWLVPIRVEQLPLKIDLSGVGLDTRGDLDVTEAAHRLEPYLEALAVELKKHAERKILIFLPLVRLSQQFAEIAQGLGLPAEHIDGNSPDRKEILARFHAGETRIVSCAMLLTEGYDEPSVDCIVMMRPTQSGTLYRQCLGRGFRPSPGKKDLLVLDPLWLSTEHSLVRPANLVAETVQEAEQISEVLADVPDLLAAMDKAKEISLELVRQKASALAEVLDATSKRERNMFDPLEMASILNNPKLAAFIPVVAWHSESVSEKQANVLRNFGIDPKAVQNRGHAHQLLSELLGRKNRGLASFRQLRCLVRYGHPNPQEATFKEASEFLDIVFSKGRDKRGIYRQLSLV